MPPVSVPVTLESLYEGNAFDRGMHGCGLNHLAWETGTGVGTMCGEHDMLSVLGTRELRSEMGQLEK